MIDAIIESLKAILSWIEIITKKFPGLTEISPCAIIVIAGLIIKGILKGIKNKKQ